MSDKFETIEPPEPLTLRDWLAKLPPQALDVKCDAIAILTAVLQTCGDHSHLGEVRVISPCGPETVGAMIDMAGAGFENTEPIPYAKAH